MKRYSLFVWVAVNIFAAATICYIVIVVHFQSKSGYRTSQREAPKHYLSTVVKLQPHSDNSSTFVNLRERLTSHKHRVISQLRQSLLQQKTSSGKHFTLNQARFFGSKKLKDLASTDLLCNFQNSLKRSHFQPLSPDSNVFAEHKHLLRSSPILRQNYETCALVSSAGALLNSELGSFIGIWCITCESFYVIYTYNIFR